jgi:hypothetical protein
LEGAAGLILAAKALILLRREHHEARLAMAGNHDRRLRGSGQHVARGVGELGGGELLHVRFQILANIGIFENMVNVFTATGTN